MIRSRLVGAVVALSGACSVLVAVQSPVASGAPLSRCTPFEGVRWRFTDATSTVSGNVWLLEVRGQSCVVAVDTARALAAEVINATAPFTVSAIAGLTCVSAPADVLGACSGIDPISGEEVGIFVAGDHPRSGPLTWELVDSTGTTPSTAPTADATGASFNPPKAALCQSFNGAEYRIPPVANRPAVWNLEAPRGSCNGLLVHALVASQYLVDPFLETKAFGTGLDICYRVEQDAAICAINEGRGRKGDFSALGGSTKPSRASAGTYLVYPKRTPPRRPAVDAWTITNLVPPGTALRPPNYGREPRPIPPSDIVTCPIFTASSWNYRPTTRDRVIVRGNQWIMLASSRSVCSSTTNRGFRAAVTEVFEGGEPASFAKSISGWGCYFSRNRAIAPSGYYLASCMRRGIGTRVLEWFTVRQKVIAPRLDEQLRRDRMHGAFFASNPGQPSRVDSIETCGGSTSWWRSWEYRSGSNGPLRNGDSWLVYTRGYPCELARVWAEFMVPIAHSHGAFERPDSTLFCRQIGGPTTETASQTEFEQALCAPVRKTADENVEEFPGLLIGVGMDNEKLFPLMTDVSLLGGLGDRGVRPEVALAP